MARGLKRFLKDDKGVVAVVFAVMAVPFIAMAGWAVDYLRLQHVKEYLQAQVDAAALNVTFDDREPSLQWNVVHAATVAEIGRHYQGDWARNVVVEHQWIQPRIDVRVTARADVPLAFIKLLPGIDDTQEVFVSAVARVQEAYWDYEIDMADLDYEAGDYNRVWAYCYWPNRSANDPNLPNRTQMVPIADNGGSANQRNRYIKDDSAPTIHPRGAEDIKDAELRLRFGEVMQSNPNGLNGRVEGVWRIVSGYRSTPRVYTYIAPLCTGDSYLSFRLENVRFARTQHDYWEKDDINYHRGGPTQSGADHSGRYDYYTDTYPNPETGSLEFGGLIHPRNGTNADVLETVLCRTREECVPSNRPGGIIPWGHNRQEGSANERQRVSGDCPAGQYMYYGWEDRPPPPPGQPGGGSWLNERWTDADFDDIRVVLKCPVLTPLQERNVRLIR